MEKAEWIIYIIDIGQQDHFEMFFTVSHFYTGVKRSKNIGELYIDFVVSGC